MSEEEEAKAKNLSVLDSFVLDERKFLHDISNKLLIIAGFSNHVEKKMKANTIDEEALKRQAKVIEAVSAIVNLVKNHKAQMLERYETEKKADDVAAA